MPLRSTTPFGNIQTHTETRKTNAHTEPYLFLPQKYCWFALPYVFLFLGHALKQTQSFCFRLCHCVCECVSEWLSWAESDPPPAAPVPRSAELLSWRDSYCLLVYYFTFKFTILNIYLNCAGSWLVFFVYLILNWKGQERDLWRRYVKYLFREDFTDSDCCA